jgi:hypothetical protein
VGFKYFALQFHFLLVEGDEIVPEFLGGFGLALFRFLHLLDAEGLLGDGTGLFFVLYDVADQLFVEGLPRLVLALGLRLLFLLRGEFVGFVVGLGSLVGAVFLMERFGLLVVLLVVADDVAEVGGGAVGGVFGPLLLEEQFGVVGVRLAVDAAGVIQFGSGVSLGVVVRFALQDVLLAVGLSRRVRMGGMCGGHVRKMI